MLTIQSDALRVLICEFLSRSLALTSFCFLPTQIDAASIERNASNSRRMTTRPGGCTYGLRDTMRAGRSASERISLMLKT
ncbi:hypothetical protein EVAR_83342_1 [Eumeta japonica]|uniref:Uncharacterized protein n=1 Tax=Eumeta variegata TaxID=151549 RepID=A0A4C1VVP2_EUMVA|nr:hypothetical protein EVAR_83342_1 [Eumeta japonica]